MCPSWWELWVIGVWCHFPLLRWCFLPSHCNSRLWISLWAWSRVGFLKFFEVFFELKTNFFFMFKASATKFKSDHLDGPSVVPSIVVVYSQMHIHYLMATTSSEGSHMKQIKQSCAFSISLKKKDAHPIVGGERDRLLVPHLPSPPWWAADRSFREPPSLGTSPALQIHNVHHVKPPSQTIQYNTEIFASF